MKQIEAIKKLDESAENQLTGYQLEQYYKYRDDWLGEVEEALTGLIGAFWKRRLYDLVSSGVIIGGCSIKCSLYISNSSCILL